MKVVKFKNAYTSGSGVAIGDSWAAMVLGGAGSQVLSPPEPAKAGECQALHFHYGGGSLRCQMTD
jgi:hypothetical protein